METVTTHEAFTGTCIICFTCAMMFRVSILLAINITIVVSNHRPFYRLFNSLCVPTPKKHQSPHYWPFVGELTGHRWISRTQTASNAEKASIWWGHHRAWLHSNTHHGRCWVDKLLEPANYSGTLHWRPEKFHKITQIPWLCLLLFPCV